MKGLIAFNRKETCIIPVIEKYLTIKFKFTGLVIALFIIIFSMFSFSKTVFAGKVSSDNQRIDVGASYYFLEPHGIYGSWYIGTVKYYNNSIKKFNYFIEADGFSRTIEGKGLLGTIGAYTIWTPWLYTYSDISSGTNYLYLPEFRADNNFNFKLGKNKNIVWEIGGSYIKYNDNNLNLIASTGLTYYYKRWIASYRLFRVISDPGNVVSWSHLYSIGYGKRYWERTYLNVTTGNEAYLTTYLPVRYQSAVNYNALNIEIRQRIWLKKDFGIIGKLDYFILQGNYRAYGISIGIFKNF
ncbi:MAG: YaiO family outer membrane beta-barrel protein [Candidatus Acidulodesulfobacterium ferriphilum]|jgi:YaiO family outer membrane protein|uniref:YaiO family outer membrane beta-barrel protein n=1 Tax=Candidatus Acidulodesulfobacterium ferriphilum TaxID=2597223 RepID=A0A519BC40_9DELT|nr:MAG: YaiO family outer membrane beta-barrel protein [Candidatus Acidulodesulfobacterium ferriphilum]